MKKQSTTTIISDLRWGAFFVVLLLLVTQEIPRALGQRGQQAIRQRPSQVEEPLTLGGATWTLTGNLNTARFLHTATVLPSGVVLVAGGLDNTFNATESAELYDPASGNWTATGNLNTTRYEHTASLLPDGKVLVAGGCDSSGNASTSSELYDPVSGTWTVTGSLNTERMEHTATLLPNGDGIGCRGNG